MKYTFKTERPTGKFAFCYKTSIYIKFNKVIVGEIDEKAPHKVRVMVYKRIEEMEREPNCKWKWISFKREFESVDKAKEWVNSCMNKILAANERVIKRDIIE